MYHSYNFTRDKNTKRTQTDTNPQLPTIAAENISLPSILESDDEMVDAVRHADEKMQQLFINPPNNDNNMSQRPFIYPTPATHHTPVINRNAEIFNRNTDNGSIINGVNGHINGNNNIFNTNITVEPVQIFSCYPSIDAEIPHAFVSSNDPVAPFNNSPFPQFPSFKVDQFPPICVSNNPINIIDHPSHHPSMESICDSPEPIKLWDGPMKNKVRVERNKIKKEKYVVNRLNHIKMIKKGNGNWWCIECKKYLDECVIPISHYFAKAIHPSHAGEKPHRCFLCPKTFVFPSGLGRHLKTHTAPKNVCKLCGIAWRNSHQNCPFGTYKKK